MPERIAITGVSGFIGGALLSRVCRERQYDTVALYHTRRPANVSRAIRWNLEDEASNLADELTGVDVLVHAAAKVHVMRDDARLPSSDYMKLNLLSTERLAYACANAGVRRLVFLSTIKVNGDRTAEDVPFTAMDPPHPRGDYAISKHRAELALTRVSRETGLEIVNLRIPLVYGPGVGANFRSMMRWVASAIPLPLGSIQNSRSMIALDNLVDLILRCAKSPFAANRTFLCADGSPISTTELLRNLAAYMGRPSRLFPCPPRVLRAIGSLTGKGDVISRLCDSLEVDMSETVSVLNWRPPVSMEDALRETARGFLSGVER